MTSARTWITIGAVVVGAVLGYFTGGLGWAMMGAALGMGAAMYLNPTSPDSMSPGQPNLGKVDIVTADEGIVLNDVLGTQKIVGNCFWYGNNRTVEIKEKVDSGGKGGGSSSKVVVGYTYFLSWAIGLTMGPVDELISVFRNDDLVWDGNLTVPLDGSPVTITLKGMGSCTFQYGTINNSPLSQLDVSLGSTTNPSLRNFCWAYMNDCEMGAANRAPSIKFVLRKTPEYAWSVRHRIGQYDYNPAHSIYYILTDLCQLPTSYLDETSFAEVAETLGFENKGMGILFSAQRDAIEYIKSILSHISAMMYFDTDGKFHLRLLRDDVDLIDMNTLIDGVDTLEPMSVTPGSWLETINDVKIQYASRYDVELGEEAIGYGDVITMGFIDESTNGTYVNCGGVHCPDDTIASCVAEPNYSADIVNYAPGAESKPWMVPGAGHVSVCCHVDGTDVQDPDGVFCPISLGVGHSPLYCDLYKRNPLKSGGGYTGYWKGTGDGSDVLDNWQSVFNQVIDLLPGNVYKPGSFLYIYIDTSSMGGLDAINPGYTAFKTWVQEEHGSLNYIEVLVSNERWIQQLHLDLTPFGYGGD